MYTNIHSNWLIRGIFEKLVGHGQPIIKEPVMSHQKKYLQLVRFFLKETNNIETVNVLLHHANKCTTVSKRQWTLLNNQTDLNLKPMDEPLNEKEKLIYKFLKHYRLAEYILCYSFQYSAREVWSDWDYDIPGTVSRMVKVYLGTSGKSFKDIQESLVNLSRGKPMYNSIGCVPENSAVSEFIWAIFGSTYTAPYKVYYVQDKHDASRVLNFLEDNVYAY